MKIHRMMTMVLGFGFLNACESDTNSSSPTFKSDAEMGTFSIGIEGLLEFDQGGKRAGSFNYENDYWEFKANGAKLRMAGRFPSSSGGVEEASTDLEYNNVYLEFLFTVGGENTKVSCKAAQEPVGQIKRTIHADLSSSGDFNIELVLCRNTYTSETIPEIQTPLTITGKFDRVPNKSTLL